MSYLGIFGLEFEKNIVVLEISTLEFHPLKKIKMAKFGTKNALFGYFWVSILKIYSHI